MAAFGRSNQGGWMEKQVSQSNGQNGRGRERTSASRAAQFSATIRFFPRRYLVAAASWLEQAGGGESGFEK